MTSKSPSYLWETIKSEEGAENKLGPYSVTKAKQQQNQTENEQPSTKMSQLNSDSSGRNGYFRVKKRFWLQQLPVYTSETGKGWNST